MNMDTYRKIAAVREQRLADLVVMNAALVAALKCVKRLFEYRGEDADGLAAAAEAQVNEALAKHDAGYPELAP
jgi:hypothetical protein